MDIGVERRRQEPRLRALHTKMGSARQGGRKEGRRDGSTEGRKEGKRNREKEEEAAQTPSG